MINGVSNEAAVLQRSIVGRVMSDKMDKTVVVQLERKVQHPKYGKYIKKRTKFYAHDENNVCKEGDWVRLKSSRPISKTKFWEVIEVIKSEPDVFVEV